MHQYIKNSPFNFFLMGLFRDIAILGSFRGSLGFDHDCWTVLSCATASSYFITIGGSKRGLSPSKQEEGEEEEERQ